MVMKFCPTLAEDYASTQLGTKHRDCVEMWERNHLIRSRQSSASKYKWCQPVDCLIIFGELPTFIPGGLYFHSRDPKPIM